MFRIFDQYGGMGVTEEYVDWLNSIKFTDLRQPIALTSDYFYGRFKTPDTWAHKKPYGVTVAYSDGHALWVRVEASIYSASRRASLLGLSVNDGWACFFFKALDKRDWTDMKSLFSIH